MDKREGILIVGVTIFVICFVGTASATNWSVDGSGGTDFTGIQEAINNASDGDTILVYSGIYYENVVVDKSVTLRGIWHPVVDAGGRESAITLTADGITLEGFSAINSGCSFTNAGIKVISSSNKITGNTVSNNSDDGICLWESSNNRITGNTVSNNNDDGIHLDDSSSNNKITGNNLSNNNDDGIYLYDSSNNNITGNTFVNDGLFVQYSYQNTVEDNTVNGKPLVYLEDVSDYKVEDAGQVILVSCNNITVENQDLANTSDGIELWMTKDSKVLNNTVSNNDEGISLWNSCNNTITGNNVSNNYGGIFLWDSSNNNTITGNNVSNNDEGISLYLSSSNNTITGNNVSKNNWGGIGLYLSSNNNTITGNNVCNNNYDGIRLDDSSNNKIYFNNLINNTDNVDSYYPTTIWNSPLEITYTYNGTTHKSYLGNYWADYKGTDADAEGDGIGDTHYRIDSEKDESDDYPLMKPFENYNIPTSAYT